MLMQVGGASVVSVNSTGLNVQGIVTTPLVQSDTIQSSADAPLTINGQGTSTALQIAGTDVATVSSSGLAVTGTASASIAMESNTMQSTRGSALTINAQSTSMNLQLYYWAITIVI